MGSFFKVNLTALKIFIMKFENPALKAAINRIPQEKAIAGIVGHAIADNFDQEGPGWKRLQAQTIRRSVAKKLKKSLSQMTDKEILNHEKQAREHNLDNRFRMILQKTGLLKKSVTVPGYSGSNKDGISGRNIFKVEGTNLIWGTDLIYAAIHNKGGNHIPKREFLVIRKQWMSQIYSFILGKYRGLIRSKIGVK